ncbi:MAG: DegV family protein [Peptococcaceae bacterium]|nr:DegV family protein [Peptococcaceae bacterium]
MNKIILSADSTCDFDDYLQKHYDVHISPLHIILGDKQYRDGVDITPDDIFKVYREHNILPKTVAINPEEYCDYFSKWTDQGYDVIHVTIGSGISSSFANCCLAAQKLKKVYPIDSYNLSLGMGLLVLEAAELISRGLSAAEIQNEINNLRPKIQASFILDTLTFLHEGGRCSSLAALSANVLNIKPCIEVINSSGKMRVGKKYRGSLAKVLKQYTLDKIKDRTDLDLDKICIVHTGISPDLISTVRSTIMEHADFKEIFVVRAGCTVSSHCGPNTLGIMFRTK